MTTPFKALAANKGLVSLVGAGPGDPELLTIKGQRVLGDAHVVVYDRLVSAEILAMANEQAEMIYVGKKLDYHCVPQDQINQLLVEKARLGKRVVRLKGGDPFMFGRGGEELEALARENIAYEVVPGITSAAGATAYAGIPLTHRDHAQTVQFITGHVQKDGQEVDWSCLARPNHTLVFYMGLKQASYIQSRLIEQGVDSNTSIAVIENGTRREQRVLTGVLSELATLGQKAKSPALIVVGSVTTLHQSLDWFPHP